MEKINDSSAPTGKSFTSLEVWKKVRTLKNKIKEIVKNFPAEESIACQTR